MTSPFASVDDIRLLWRELTTQETERAKELLPIVSDALRMEARRVQKDLDAMVTSGELTESVVKAVTVDVVSRVLRQDTQGEAMTQESQGALGYSWSGTYAVPGGGILNAIMKNDLKRLGLRRQRYGVIDFYGEN